jgi:hypothetical protein
MAGAGVEGSGSAVPFIGAREGERDGGDGELRHDSGRPRMRGRLGHSGGVVAEAGEH